MLGGCASIQGPTAQLGGRSIAASKVEIVYRVERGPSGKSAAGDAASRGRVSTLFISSPHASCKPGYARVELIEQSGIDAADSSSKSSSVKRFADTMEGILPGIRLGEGIDAAWSLEVRETEVQKILAELKSSGFFQEPCREFDEQVVLVVRKDDVATSHRWQSTAALNQLRAQVKKAGRLVGYTGPAMDAAALLPESTAAPKMVRLPEVGQGPTGSLDAR
jgi:hypothetical protein